MKEIIRQIRECKTEKATLQNEINQLCMPLQREIELCEPEVTAEVRCTFKLPSLERIKIRAKVATDLEECLEFENVILQFNYVSHTYIFEEYICNFIRVYDIVTMPLFSDLMKIHRDQLDLNALGEVEMDRTRFTSFEEMMIKCGDIHEIATTLDGRIETLFQWIKSRFGQYLYEELRQLKHCIRLIIWSYMNGDGQFSVLPFELVQRICCIALM